ncbi:4,5-dihydroxyphthalate decarboxylase [Amycolatopsis sp. NBRC 101858]|uniref:4,5-dihydroxyphthalate decarboxylase n=1 Tax=Amycolatopsis sp. NBRC 101858 TaxID=3032200 RepID=UPI0024A35630|nr:4,5-dihydroxyphthalate decarboxylase [Amycolatopsis sp. NBRC 101858]GLY34150.1 4,5-dihydroxyphthalate decarboxylase [Amycolatopsis sp. NBRC 101858]
MDLRIGSFRYDNTEALFDGSVTVAGAGSTTMSTAATLPEIFGRLAREEVEVSEFGLTFFLRALDQGVPLVAIPAFPVRLFRHSAVFVHAGSGITGPADLVGKTIGEFGVYGQDPGVWMKGILADEHGFKPEANRWVIGGLDHPAPPFEFTSHPHPDGLDITTAPEGRALSGMLESGEIDALFTANVPQPFLDGSPNITRLFPDYETVERDYYRRTGNFPIMHTVVARRDLLAANPGLARAVYTAFDDAKEAGADRYRKFRRLYEAPVMLPWANALMEENDRLFGEDWWPYGVSANRSELDTFLRYHHEQGLSKRRWTVEEIFAPELLDT